MAIPLILHNQAHVGELSPAGWDTGPSHATSPAEAGTQLLLGGEKQVGLCVLLKDTEKQIMVTQPSIKPRTSHTGVLHSCNYTTALPLFNIGGIK